MARIGNVNALLSVNTAGFSAGLNFASNELSKFGRHVSDAFGKNLPNFTLPVFGGTNMTAIEKELAAINDTPRAVQALQTSSVSAAHSIKALSGGLFLLTGQTGFFAIEAARAASHVSKLTQEAGGFVAGLTAMAGGFKALLASIGPVGWALIAAAATYEVFSRIADKSIENTKKKMEELEAQARRMEPLLKATLENAVLLGKATPQDVRFEELRAQGLTGEQARAVVEKELDNERLRRGKEIERAIFENKSRAIDEAIREQENLAKKLADSEEAFRKEQIDREWEFEKDKVRIAAEEAREKMEIAARLADQQKEAAQAALISAGVAKRHDFINDPFLEVIANFNERIDALKSDPNKIGADFSVSAMTFRGNAPTGDVFGQQREQAKANEHLAEIEDLNRELVSFVKANGLGVAID